MPNRLAHEHSPYLLQHKDNPVDWYPWGEEAFERARREQKPIFLSVGYSTCHWCHVMEHESFENAEVAEVLNRDFVSIKVDREERPDVDRVYMTFVQATTGSGGWPMSVWLTPDLRPFYGGTYFPPVSRWGRPGFVDLLREIARLWRDERDRVVESARDIVEQLRRFGEDDGHGAGEVRPPPPRVLDEAVAQYRQAFDARFGGFGAAPKFPRPSELLFLLREHARTGSAEALEMATATLRAIGNGGMRDHLGGGFHRYAVDREWRVPHFEKMLYDQAQLALAYLEASQATGDGWYRDVAVETLDYVRRDLADPEGGCFSAEDADSVPPEQADDPSARRMEGAWYLWTDREIGEALGPDAAVFRLRYGIKPDGNAPHDPHGEFRGKNLLYLASGIEEIAARTDMTAADVEAALARARAVLFARRASRPRPHLDDKVLAAWNGLTIASLARAARVLDASDADEDAARAHQYLQDAARAATFIRTRLWDESTLTLYRRFRRGNTAVAAYAEDYACVVFGLLELFQAGGDAEWLQWALVLQRRQDELFADPRGGWFSSSGDDPAVLLRLKDDHDGAEPSASSIGVMNLIVLSHLVGDDRHATIERTLGSYGSRPGIGRTMPMMASAISAYHAGVSQVVVAGRRDEPAARALRRVVARHYLPFTVMLPLDPERREAVAELLPWTAAMLARDRGEAPEAGLARAFVCRRFTCDWPAATADELETQLRALTSGAARRDDR